MVRCLDRTRYEPYVICPPGGELARLLDAEGVTCVPAPPVHARFTWRPGALWMSAKSVSRAIVALREALAFLRPDIVHANTLRAGIVTSLASAGTGRKVVWHLHDILPRHPLSTVIRVTTVFLRPARIVAVSEATAKAFRGPYFSKAKITTIHNGTDLSRFPLKSTGSAALRESLGIPEDSFMICAVGQICARKGLLELVDAVAKARAHAPQIHLVIAGSVVFEHEKGYFDLLRTAAAAPHCSNAVHFAGEVQNVSALLQAADLLVLNSREEPFGLVLVEAMASGTPVLATRVGGIPEIVKDGRNGWLIEKGDITALAAKLVELSRCGEALATTAGTARRETCPQFSLERFQRRLHRLYAELLSSPNPQWNANTQPAIAADLDD